MEVANIRSHGSCPPFGAVQRFCTLPPVELGSSRAEVSGWILFSVKSKWIGPWKKPEEFVLRIPIGDRLAEFPFSLPAQGGDLILRQR